MARLSPAAACAVVSLLVAAIAHGLTIPTSEHVLELNEWSFQRVTAAGSDSDTIYFVQFYASDCRACKRVAHQWDLLAESVAASGPRDDVLTARVNCEEAEKLCVGLGVEHTPTFKVFYQGRDVYTYRSGFYLAELMIPFIRKFSANIRGIDLPPDQPMSAA